jgi:hypothetical protein
LKLELKVGHRTARGRKGTVHAYIFKSYRYQERRWAEQAEAAYARYVAGWNPGGQRGARAPQRRSDYKGCGAGLAPRALFFATRSPVRDRRLSRSPKKALVDHIRNLRAIWRTQPRLEATMPGQSRESRMKAVPAATIAVPLQDKGAHIMRWTPPASGRRCGRQSRRKAWH